VPAAVRYSMAQMLHRSRFFASDSPENRMPSARGIIIRRLPAPATRFPFNYFLFCHRRRASGGRKIWSNLLSIPPQSVRQLAGSRACYVYTNKCTLGEAGGSKNTSGPIISRERAEKCTTFEQESCTLNFPRGEQGYGAAESRSQTRNTALFWSCECESQQRGSKSKAH
jgi:hypothetical protein